jgi:hypothetical protein
VGKIESRLDYKKIDNPLVLMTAGGNVAARFAFNVVYGYGSIAGARGTDTTYFADGAELASTLDWVTAKRQGAYAELLLKF